MQKKSILSCLSAALLFFYIIFQMTVFNSISTHLVTQFGLSQIEIGNISSLYFYCAAISLVFYGLLLDYYPTRTPGLYIMTLCVLAVFLFAIFPSTITVSIYRIICGLTNPLVFLICMQQAPMWFPRKTSLAISLIITIGMLGGMMQYPFSLVMNHLGRQQALLIDGGLGVLLLILNGYFLADHKTTEKMANQYQLGDLWQHLKQALCVKENWLCGIFTGCLNLPVLVLGATWGDHYLMESRGLSQSTAAFVISMIFFGMIFASPFFGWFADACRSRKRAMFFGSLASILTILMIMLFNHSNLWVLSALFFLLGFMCTSQIISYTVVNEINHTAQASTAMSWVSILIYLIAALGNPLFGAISTHFSINKAIFILPIAFIFSLLASLLIRETYAKPATNY